MLGVFKLEKLKSSQSKSQIGLLVQLSKQLYELKSSLHLL